MNSVRLLSIVCSVVLLFSLPHEARGESGRTDKSVSPANLPSEDMLKSMPADYFIENAGQLSNKDVLFYTTSGDMQMGFAESAVLIKRLERPPASMARLTDRELMRPPPPEPEPSRGVLLRLNFEGSNMVTPQGRVPMPHSTNFFIGNDPSLWRTNVRSYREVVYEGLYDGVDLVYHVTDKGVKYDFIIAPGADLSVIEVSYEGADSVELGAAGGLIVRTATGDVGDSSPIAFQDEDEVQCSFAPRDLLSYGFACNGVDRSREVVVDPLIYSTYLGGGDIEWGDWIAIDSAGNAYVTGSTKSVDFPATAGAFDATLNTTEDAFVAKLDSTGSSLVYSTYLGGNGSGGDYGRSIMVDSTGNAYLTGITYSADFPVTAGAFDTTFNASGDAFVAKLDSTGSSLLLSTYLGGDLADYGWSIAIDSTGNAYVVGFTYSTDFPVTLGAFDTTLNGTRDIFVAKLDSAFSSLLYSTYLGGGGEDVGMRIVTDIAGNAYVAGQTYSADFPVTAGAFDTTLNGTRDGFMAKLDSTGSSLFYSTYIGGDNEDYIQSIVIDSAGNAYVIGVTGSADLPVTPGAFDATLNGTRDAFVSKLDSTGSSLLLSTYLGGGDGDIGYSILVDSAGSAYIAGYTASADFPVTPGAFDATLNGTRDAFVSKLDSAGSSLLYSTYLGGGGDEYGTSITMDSSGRAYVTGATYSADFPVTAGAFDTTLNGTRDAFVVKLGLPNSPPTIAITSPSSGEVWTQGSPHPVTWTASDIEDTPSALLVWINYTSSAGSGSVCGPAAGDVGSCSWTLPSITATDVVVNGTVVDTGGLKGYDESGQFTIQAPPNTPPTVTLTSPTGGEEWLKGSSHTIAWTMHDDEDVNANLTIFINYTTGGVTSTVVAALKGHLSFAWTLPGIEANDVVVNITVIDTGGLKGWSQSGPFTIKAPPSPPPDFLSQYWWLMVVIVVAMVIVLLLLLLKRRKPKEENGEVPPSRIESTPPNEKRD